MEEDPCLGSREEGEAPFGEVEGLDGPVSGPGGCLSLRNYGEICARLQGQIVDPPQLHLKSRGKHQP